MFEAISSSQQARCTFLNMVLWEYPFNSLYLTSWRVLGGFLEGYCSTRLTVARATQRSGRSDAFGQRKLDRHLETRAWRAIAQAQRAPITADQPQHDGHAEARTVRLGAR